MWQLKAEIYLKNTQEDWLRLEMGDSTKGHGRNKMLSLMSKNKSFDLLIMFAVAESFHPSSNLDIDPGILD